MNPHDQFEYSEKRGFLARYGFVIGIVVVAGIGGILFNKMFSGPKGPPPRKQQEMVMIKPPPPAPPPPPPPPTPPQETPKEQMMEQTPVDAEEAKPEEAPSDPSPSIGTNITGNGPADGFGLSGNKGGFLGNGSNSGRVNRSQFGWYANQVIKSFSEALSRNPRTQNASFNVKARVWADAGGRVIRVKLVESTGDPVLDDAIRNEALTGLQLKEPPPENMPMPIVTRLIARRPS